MIHAECLIDEHPFKIKFPVIRLILFLPTIIFFFRFRYIKCEIVEQQKKWTNGYKFYDPFSKMAFG